jgi:hypothetical protein
MSAYQTEVIRQRLEQELSTVQRAAGISAGEDRLALETLERVFRARLADLPQRRSIAPIRVEDVLPPAHPHIVQ